MDFNLVDVSFKNFMSYGNSPQFIKFLPGMNLITGSDVDLNRSNGSGKSSSLLTIPFALFGRTDKDVKKDQIINWNNKKNCEVTLNFSKNNDSYTILRAIKPDKLEIYKNGVLIQPPSDVRMYQKQFETDVLNTSLDFDMFMYMIYTNLNSNTPLLRMSTPQKRDFIENIFGLEVYTKLNEKSNERLKNIYDVTLKLSTENDQLKISVSDLEKQNNSLKLKIRDNSIQPLIEELAEKELELELYDKLEPVLEEPISLEIDVLTKSFNDINEAVNSKKIDVVRISSENKNILDKITEMSNRHEKTQKQLNDLKIELESIGINEPTLSDRAKCTFEISDIVKEKELLNNDLISSELELKEFIKKFNLIKDGVCPTCGQSCEIILNDDNFLSTKSRIDEHIQEVKLKITSLLEGMTVITKTLSDDDDAIKTNLLKKNKKDIINSKMDSILKMNEENSCVEEYDETVSYNEIAIFNLTSEIEKMDTEKTSIKSRLTDLISEKSKIIDRIKKIESLKSYLDKLKSEIESKRSIIDNINGIITENVVNINKNNEKIKDNSIKQTKMSSLIDYFEQIKIICKDDNVKQYAISSTLPYLENKTNFYLSESGHAHYIKFDKWLTADINGNGMHSVTYNSLSSGEQRGINLSIQFAFLDISKMRSTIFPDILMLDEILDSSIDSFGMTNILRIIKTRQMEENNKIFIITHRQEVSDVDFDHVYNVSKSNGFSVINQIR